MKPKVRKSMLALLAVALLLTGCIYSDNPLYSDDAAVYYAEILGHYDSDAGAFDIQKGDDATSYRLVQIDKGKEASSQKMHLVKLNDQIFLDLETTLNANGNRTVHNWCRATFEKGTIVLWDLVSAKGPQGDKVRAFNEGLKYRTTVSGSDIATLTTKELQALVSDNTDLFSSEILKLKRKVE